MISALIRKSAFSRDRAQSSSSLADAKVNLAEGGLLMRMTREDLVLSTSTERLQGSSCQRDQLTIQLTNILTLRPRVVPGKEEEALKGDRRLAGNLSRGKEGARWVVPRVRAVAKAGQVGARVDRAEGSKAYSKAKVRTKDTLGPSTLTERRLANSYLRARSSIPSMSILRKDHGSRGKYGAPASAEVYLMRMRSRPELAIPLRG